jgi:hypothetical protein
MYPGGRRSVAKDTVAEKTRVTSIDATPPQDVEDSEDEIEENGSELQPVMKKQVEELHVEANQKDTDGLNCRPTAV